MQANQLILESFHKTIKIQLLFSKHVWCPKLYWKRLMTNWANDSLQCIGLNLALKPLALDHQAHFPWCQNFANSGFQFSPNVEPSGLAGGPRDTVCWLELWLWQSRRHKLVPRRAPVPSPASKLDRHTSTHSSLDLFHHLSWNCNLMTPDFEVGIWFSDFSTFHQSWHQPWPVSELLTFILDRELLGILANWWNFSWKLPK